MSQLDIYVIFCYLLNILMMGVNVYITCNNPAINLSSSKYFLVLFRNVWDSGSDAVLSDILLQFQVIIVDTVNKMLLCYKLINVLCHTLIIYSLLFSEFQTCGGQSGI